ncbi:DUF6247 family protein [Streptomyces beijiangensis]|uniref:DUF6247 family protein n=1 Tax=Streptomyces beijiangensis TaxID=163361 RepID=UPI0031DFD8F7
MSAQPVHQHQAPPAPGAAAQLRRQIAEHAAAARWLPAFERDWNAALEESRATFDLSALHEVVREWQGRLATAPAVAAFIASGYEDTDSVALEDVIGASRR